MENNQRIGLVLGKFMPFHKGHMALIDFAASQCQKLIVLVGATPREPIPGHYRFSWVDSTYYAHPVIEVLYTQKEFPESKESSRYVSQAWATYLKQRFPEVNTIFTSEPYGDYVAEYMDIEHICFDQPREQVPISATMIRENPIKYWDYIAPEARKYFTQNVCLYGPESVGKSTMSEKLAKHFGTVFQREEGRYMMETSHTCTRGDMPRIANAQAVAMGLQKYNAEKILICDSDLTTTLVYSEYLFGTAPFVLPSVYKANEYALHLFFEADVPYVQDGTRLGEETRPELRDRFLAALHATGQHYVIIKGTDWEGRFQACVEAINKYVLNPIE